MHERLNAINKAAIDLRLDGEMVSVKVMLIPEDEGNFFRLKWNSSRSMTLLSVYDEIISYEIIIEDMFKLDVSILL